MRIKRIKARTLEKSVVRVCAYVRVSTDSLEQEESLENQTRFFTDYISDHEGWVLTQVYSDQGISGYMEARNGFQTMMKDARNHDFDLILVKSVSRFARNTETTLKATRELKQLGIGVYFCLQDTNTLTSSGELMLTVRAAFAQAESEVGSDTLKMVYRRKFEKGIPSHKIYRTFGYQEGADHQLIVFEEQAQWVRFIYEKVAQGVWVGRITKYLNEHNVPTKENKKWSDRTVARMLQNVTYKGDLLLQKTYKDARHITRANHGEVDQWYIRGNHPAIVSPELWEQAQTMMKQRTAQLNRKLEKPNEQRSSHTRYPLTGLMHCPYCGAKLTHFWGNQRREYWVCRTNVKVSAAACKGIYVPAATTDGWNIHEPVVVVKYTDKDGMTQFTAYPVDEFNEMKEKKDGKID